MFYTCVLKRKVRMKSRKWYGPGDGANFLRFFCLHKIKLVFVLHSLWRASDGQFFGNVWNSNNINRYWLIAEIAFSAFCSQWPVFTGIFQNQIFHFYDKFFSYLFNSIDSTSDLNVEMVWESRFWWNKKKSKWISVVTTTIRNCFDPNMRRWFVVFCYDHRK